MRISIFTSAYDATSILMEHHMSSYSYLLVRHTLVTISHIFGPVKKQAKEQVIYKVELLSALNVGARTNLEVVR